MFLNEYLKAKYYRTKITESKPEPANNTNYIYSHQSLGVKKGEKEKQEQYTTQFFKLFHLYRKKKSNSKIKLFFLAAQLLRAHYLTESGPLLS